MGLNFNSSKEITSYHCVTSRYESYLEGKYNHEIHTQKKTKIFEQTKEEFKKTNLEKFEEMIESMDLESEKEIDKLDRVSLLNCTIFSDIKKKGLVNLMKAKMQNLKVLDLSGVKNLQNESILDLISCCKQLVKLNLKEVVLINDEIVKKLNFDNLKIFKSSHSKISDRSGPYFVLLHVLDLSFSVYVSDNILKSLKNSCLRKIRLINCDLITDKIFDYLDDGKYIY